MQDITKSALLLLILLNPFLVIVYLFDAIQKLDSRRFRKVLLRASLVATLVFCLFALIGDAIFSDFLQAEFASFQIFGGIVFLLIGIQFMFRGPLAIEMLRGESCHLAGAIAMPVLIGPGTISASVVIGKRHEPVTACVVILAAVSICVFVMMCLKWIHDVVRQKNETLIERYIEIAGRVTALVVGTISVDMIMRGLRGWAEKFPG